MDKSSPYRVLVVEDDITLRETVAYNLGKEGYEVLSAEDGYAALETARREQPDLLLLDVMLPGLDGFEVCRRVRMRSDVPTSRSHSAR